MGRVCNMCGKSFGLWDQEENRGLHDNFGYGSKHDGDAIDLDLCCDCFDNVFDDIRKKCKYDPLVQFSTGTKLGFVNRKCVENK